ncbi:hypothetical protein D3C84_1132320 [compost metagenome]
MDAVCGEACWNIVANTEHFFCSYQFNGNGRDHQEVGRPCRFPGFNFSLEEAYGEICDFVQTVDGFPQRHAFQTSFHLLAGEGEHR